MPGATQSGVQAATAGAAAAIDAPKAGTSAQSQTSTPKQPRKRTVQRKTIKSKSRCPTDNSDDDFAGTNSPNINRSATCSPADNLRSSRPRRK